MRFAGCMRRKDSATRFPISRVHCSYQNWSSKTNSMIRPAKMGTQRAGKRRIAIPSLNRPRAEVRAALRWRSCCASRPKRTCCTIPPPVRPACAGSDSLLFTKPRGAAPPLEASTTFRHFFRREWRAHSAAAWRASAGRTIHGPVFRGACESMAGNLRSVTGENPIGHHRRYCTQGSAFHESQITIPRLTVHQSPVTNHQSPL
jgi:hypothetical protein